MRSDIFMPIEAAILKNALFEEIDRDLEQTPSLSWCQEQ